MSKRLPELAEPFFRDPKVVKQGDEYLDDPASLFAFTAHGFDTDLDPFYSASQLKEAMQAAWDAALEAAAQEPTPSEIRLAAGEMTAQEMRTVRAILSWRASAIRSMKGSTP